MFQSSGSMYEEIEQDRLRKKRHKQVIIKRIIAIILLSLIVIYLLILFIDTRRFKHGKLPLITTKVETKEYDDGTVTSYYSIGWIFRFYDRETIKDSELVPINRDIKMDNVLKRYNDPDLEEPEKDYEIPNNSMKQEKISNVLFFYNEDDILGTYACLLSDYDCEISISKILEEDPLNSPKIKMNIIDNRYVFITEYKNKNTDAEEEYIYLYDINAKNYIAKYEDVRYSIIKEGKGYIDSSKYIVKKNGLWGIDQVIKGKVTNYLDYKYKYIKYDEDSNLYILKTNEDKWLVFNANDKVLSKELDISINDVYLVDNKMYMLTYEEINYKKNYKLYNQEGINVLTKDNIDNLVAYDKYLTYVNDNKLHIINYDGEELIDSITIYLTETQQTSKIKQYTLNNKNNILIIKVPTNNNNTHIVDEYHYDTNTWQLIKKINPQETISY